MKIRISLFLLFIIHFALISNTNAQTWDSLYTNGEEYFEKGDYNNAFLLIEKSLKQAEIEFGVGHKNYASSLNDLGALYTIFGKYEKALQFDLEALTIFGKTIGKDHQDYGTCLNNLGELYEAMGEYDKALPAFLEALSITERALGKFHPDYAERVNNLAALYEIMGQYEKALPLFQEALKITENSVGKEHSDYGQRLNNLGLIYVFLGQYEKALPLYLEALEIAEKKFGKEHREYGIYLSNLADLYEKMGQKEKALTLYTEALKITEKSLGKNHPLYGERLNNLGLAYFNMDQYENAMPLFVEAIANREKSLGKDHPDYSVCLNNFAMLYVCMGQYEKAMPLYQESKNNVLKNIDKNFTFLSETEKEKYYATISSNFKVYKSFYLKFLNQDTKVAADAYDLELATKGMILNAGVEMRQNILNSGDTTALSLYDDWKSAKTKLAKEYTKRIVKRDSMLIVTQEEKANDLEAKLTKLSGTFKESKSLFDTRWQDIQKALREKEVAIEFSSFNYYNGKKFTDTIMYVALVLRKNDSFPLLVPLFEKKSLDSLLYKNGATDAEFISGLYSGANQINDIGNASNGKSLFNLIWKPLDSLLHKGDKIYFAPTGSLHQIAFSAIPYNSTTLLSDRYTLTQLNSTAMLLRAPKFKETLPPSITIFGGIQYDVTEQELLAMAEKDKEETVFVSRSLPEDLNRGNSWKYLPGTFTEAKTIDSVAQQKKINVSMYSGKEATEETFKKITGNNSPRVLHIATHGFFFPDPKKQKKNTFGDESQQVFRSSDNPLNRAGLLLAGANKAWKGDTLPANVEDGILTAYEVSNVSLNNTELVVLSACETGLGDIKGSEGVFGLQRAFKMAGAEYLLMSLWKVPDVETTELMSKFYSTWFSGKTIPEAFHLTQAYMKSKYPNDPYKWAAFVLVE